MASALVFVLAVIGAGWMRRANPRSNPAAALKLAVAFALPNGYFRREIQYNDGAQSVRPPRQWETTP